MGNRFDIKTIKIKSQLWWAFMHQENICRKVAVLVAGSSEFHWWMESRIHVLSVSKICELTSAFQEAFRTYRTIPVLGGKQNKEINPNKTNKKTPLQQSLPLPAGITVWALKAEGERSTSGQAITIISQKIPTTSLHETEANQWDMRRLLRVQI